MPVVPDAQIEISAFSWVPPFARGQVRDLRVRWALEEIGLPYRVRLLNAMEERPADYFREQPWGQCRYKMFKQQLTECSERLLPEQKESFLSHQESARIRIKLEQRTEIDIGSAHLGIGRLSNVPT